MQLSAVRNQESEPLPPFAPDLAAQLGARCSFKPNSGLLRAERAACRAFPKTTADWLAPRPAPGCGVCCVRCELHNGRAAICYSTISCAGSCAIREEGSCCASKWRWRSGWRNSSLKGWLRKIKRPRCPSRRCLESCAILAKRRSPGSSRLRRDHCNSELSTPLPRECQPGLRGKLISGGCASPPVQRPTQLEPAVRFGRGPPAALCP